MVRCFAKKCGLLFLFLSMGLTLAGCETFYSFKRQADYIQDMPVSCIQNSLKNTPGVRIDSELVEQSPNQTSPYWPEGTVMRPSQTEPDQKLSHGSPENTICYSYNNIPGGCITMIRNEDGTNKFINEIKWWTHGSPPPQHKIDETVRSIRHVNEILAQQCGVHQLNHATEECPSLLCR